MARQEFEELRELMLQEKHFKDPVSFFQWALGGYKGGGMEELTPKSFAFELFDVIAKLEDSDEIFEKIIEQASTVGIKPWENVFGLRLQGSTCLSEFIEKDLA